MLAISNAEREERALRRSDSSADRQTDGWRKAVERWKARLQDSHNTVMGGGGVCLEVKRAGAKGAGGSHLTSGVPPVPGWGVGAVEYM